MKAKVILNIFIAAFILAGCTPPKSQTSPEAATTEASQDAAQLQTQMTMVTEQFITPAPSQNDSRIIQLASPRMNGQDVLDLQNRLLSLGFSGVGEADGYYGPLSEGVIKSVQTFSGFKPNLSDSELEDIPYWERNYARFLPDGKVNSILRDYIFDGANAPFLRNISAVLQYDTNNLMESKVFEETTIADEEMVEYRHINEYVYASPADHKVKIIKYSESVTRGNLKEIMYYFVNDVYYFIHYKVTDSVEGLYSELETYLVDDGYIFIMINGIPREYGDTSLREFKDDILNKYIAG